MAANIVTPTTSRNDLNNDCLRNILLYIEVNQRIKLRTVCKKWRNTVDDCWRKVREVIIFDPVCKYGGNNKEEIVGTHQLVTIKTSDQPVIAGVMKRCADVIKTLSEDRQGKNNSALPLAIKYCTNIERLGTTVGTKVDDKNASKLLAINKKLRGLRITIDFEDAKRFFLKIPTDYLAELQLFDQSNSPAPSIMSGQKLLISKCSSLKKLTLNHLDDKLLGIVGQKIKLENLELVCNSHSTATSGGLTAVSNLTNLRHLAILAVCSGTPVTDDVLMTFAENLSLLEVLKIGHPEQVTDRGFKSLAALKKLKELTIPGGSR